MSLWIQKGIVDDIKKLPVNDYLKSIIVNDDESTMKCEIQLKEATILNYIKNYHTVLTLRYKDFLSVCKELAASVVAKVELDGPYNIVINTTENEYYN